MSETIPDDIVKAGRRTYDQLGRGSMADSEIIARAILAERKRCAEVASEHAQNAERRDREYWGAASEAEAIARAILTPSKEPQT